MNEYQAKKLGEVLAFCRSGLETLEKGKKAMIIAFAEENFRKIYETNLAHQDEIRDIARENNVLEKVEAKAQKTSEKIKKMRDLYLENEEDWNDPNEMLEWTGFFEGGAYVHWGLVEGIAENENIKKLKTLAKAALDLHHETLHQAGENLKRMNNDK